MSIYLSTYLSFYLSFNYPSTYLSSIQAVSVRTVEQHELSRHMLPPVLKDDSKALVSPMPGTLV